MNKLKLFENLINCKELANVEFLVGKQSKKLYAHKLILSLRSQFLKQILYPCGWEQSKVQIVQITLSDITLESFEVILNYLYTNSIELNFDLYWDVLLCSKKFQLQRLNQICLKWFQSQVKETNFIDLFRASYHRKNHETVGVLLCYFESNFSNLIHQENFFNQLEHGMIPLFLKKMYELTKLVVLKGTIVKRLIEFIVSKRSHHNCNELDSNTLFLTINNLFHQSNTSNEKDFAITKMEIEQILAKNFLASKTDVVCHLNDKKSSFHMNDHIGESRNCECNGEQNIHSYPELEYLSNLKSDRQNNLLKPHEGRNGFAFIANGDPVKRIRAPEKIEVKKLGNKNNIIPSLSCVQSPKNQKKTHTHQQKQQQQTQLRTQEQQQGEEFNLLNNQFSSQDVISSLKINNEKQKPALPRPSQKRHISKVLLITTDQTESHLEDMKKSILYNNNIGCVHTFFANVATPNYNYLKEYDSIFLFSSIISFHDPKKLGNMLAKFVDNGGGLVMSTYRCLFEKPKKYKGAELMGRIVTKGYLPINKGVLKDKRSSLGEILIKNHPLIKDIKKFDGGLLSYRIQFNENSLIKNSNFQCQTGMNNLNKPANNFSIIVAKWSDGNPLIFYNYSPNKKGKIVYLNLWPISGDVYGYKGKYNYWQSKFDGRKIISNAIHFSTIK
ncbi:btb/poz domain-containing protein [Anaeramoeba flamelloides]|uniref:Btb/poz domain-containing protein n=1 Tax=Anaeramoeba flamelloides TaxID=1746091 RepID=A0ABQ8X0N5_9EUKA|nr:btb/poz domain-containing protein [Anaeramoeba flamelloides]